MEQRKAVVKTLYFSPKSDADLIEMYHQLGAKKIAKAIKESLRMVVRPGYHSEFVDNLSLDPTSKTNSLEAVSINISFNAEGDGDLRTLLASTLSGKMSHLMKMALRYAVGPYFTLGYYLKGNDSLTKNYQKKELFFVEGARERIVTKVVEKQVVASVAENLPVQAEEPSKPQQPVSYDFSELSFSSDEEDDSGSNFDDEDILAMLDNL